MSRHAIVALALLMAPSSASAQPAAPTTQNVEVEPVTCWWRTAASSVRVGQPFSLVLTCSALETEATKVVIDRGRLAAAAVQLPPYEVTSGTQSDDITTASRRFLQYEYTLRLIGDDVFGADVPVPSLQISYRVESNVQQDAAVQGREQTYVLPPLPVHVASLVPASETHIREAPVPTLAAITARQTRGAFYRTIGTIAFTLAGLLLVVALVRAFQQRRSATATVRTHLLRDAAVLSGVGRELRQVQQQATREGWSESLAARALAAARVTGSYAAGQPVAQRVVNGTAGDDRQLVIHRPLRSSVLVSGSATAEAFLDTPDHEDVRSALADLTAARYGRSSNGNADYSHAIESALRATDRIARRHTWIAQSMTGMRRGLLEWRERVWAR